MVRAFYYGWYSDLVTQLPLTTKGEITAPEGAGHGLSLHRISSNEQVITSAHETLTNNDNFLIFRYF